MSANKHGRYEIEARNGQWIWRLRAANWEIIASGESYWNYNDCLSTVELVRGLNTHIPIVRV